MVYILRQGEEIIMNPMICLSINLIEQAIPCNNLFRSILVVMVLMTTFKQCGGLLFAPKSGAETLELIRSKADESKDYLRRRSSELRDSANDAIERGKTAVSKQRDHLAAAVEAGKQAYREAVTGASPA